METLAQSLAAEIALSGPIPFRRFMERALYDASGGYYASGRAAIGKGGDFITNVSIGPLFGRLLAGEFHAMWVQMDRPELFTIVEQGANTGDFAHDVLSAVAAKASTDADWAAWQAALRYHIVEPLPRNIERQKERLTLWVNAGSVAWFPSLEALPRFTGVHFSNELLDAMPVHALAFRHGAWHERSVANAPKAEGAAATTDPTFQWAEGPLSHSGLEAALPHLAPAAVEGMETEVNLEALAWLEAVAARLERGYVLIADYGFARCDYYLPSRTSGTLTGYRDHKRSTDLLAEPGEHDLTAHVEFTSLAERARALGLEVVGFTDQHHYMVGLGKGAFPDAEGPLSPEAQRELRAFSSLMHPALMGRGFQFMGLAQGAPLALPGFAFARPAAEALGLE